MQKIITFIIVVVLLYIAYQAHWFDGPINYFVELSKQGPRDEETVDGLGIHSKVEHKSIYNHLKEFKNYNNNEE